MKSKNRAKTLDKLLSASGESLLPKNPADRDKLADLLTQREALKATLKNARNETGLLSRKIGKAKSSGEPADDLIIAMQAHGKVIRDTSDQISNIEQSALQLVGLAGADNPDGMANARPATAETQRYSGVVQGPVTVSLMDTNTDDWNSYANSQAHSSAYHLAEWRNLITGTFGHTAFYCIARDSTSSVVGILPLVRLKSFLFGDFLVSMPYFNYGGALGNSPEVEQALMAYGANIAHQLGASHVEFRDEIRHADYPARDEKVNMVLGLPQDTATLWDSFPSKLRSQIRRAQRENPVIRAGGLELLDDFYLVFARNMRDLGTPVYGREFFSNILKTFPDTSKIITVSLHGKPVSAGFLLGHADKMERPWASTIRDMNHFSINMVLYWEVLKFTTESGYRRFDFGRSTIGGGTYRFKQQWGARPVQLYWHYWLSKSGELPSLNPSNPKFALFIRLWRMLPVGVTKLVGPAIVKNLP